MIRVGILGAGTMAAVHAQAWQAAGATVTGVWSHSEAGLAQRAAQLGVRPFPNVDSLCAEVDLIDICTPSDSHHTYALQAARAGRHVVCEKPIALTLRDAQSMIQACRAAGVELFVAHVARFYPEYRAAQAVLASGEIGDLSVLRLRSTSSVPSKSHDNWYLDPARSGGLLLDLMIHDFDTALWLGGPVNRISARAVQPYRPDWAGDYALITLRFASGAIAQLEGGWIYPQGVFRTSIDIAGTAGLVEYHSDQAVTLRAFPRTAPMAAPADEVALGLPTLADDPFALQCRHILAVLAGREAALLRPEDALAALRLALAARSSLEQGEPVRLAEWA